MKQREKVSRPDIVIVKIEPQDHGEADYEHHMVLLDAIRKGQSMERMNQRFQTCSRPARVRPLYQ